MDSFVTSGKKVILGIYKAKTYEGCSQCILEVI